MSAMFDNPNKTYIKSNAGTVMHFLWFVCGLLLLLVAGLCAFVIFGRDDTSNYHLDSNGQFYYQLNNNQATLVEFVDRDAEKYIVPTSVNYGGKNYAITTIDSHAFSNLNRLTEVEFPDSVTEICGNSTEQTGAFSGCVALKKVKLGQGVTHIGSYAFKNCLTLSEIDFPSSVQFVDDGAFMGCLNLQSITLRSNGVLGSYCFDDCLNVKTLVLSNDVSLADSAKRQVLAALPKLTDFNVDNNQTYTVVNHCIVTTTKTQNDTVVLGGYGAQIPDGVKRIEDWAWGKRSSNIVYVPSGVEMIGANSFNKGVSIYTDAEDQPNGWLTNLPIYTKARQVICDANITGVEPVSAYVYYDDNGIESELRYEDLFYGVKTETPFKKWIVTGTTYTAEYQSTNTAKTDDLNRLEAELNIATGYLNDEDERLKFKLDFWENFKTVYYQCAVLNSQSYQYQVKQLTTQLHNLNQKIAQEDSAILESTDWTIGLKNLVDAIKNLVETDLADTVTNAQLISELYRDTNEQGQVSKITTAKTFLTHKVDDETAQNLWKDLRELFEQLQVDCGEDSPLQKEIKTCKKLNRADYSDESWQNLQNQLKAAELVVAQNLVHTLTVSTLRENLASARVGLREITLSVTFAELNAWISICEDLPKSDYEISGYDSLQLETVTTLNRIDSMENSRAVNSAIANLKSRYRNLVPTDSGVKYQSSTGIINKKSIPFFITAVMLFTGAVAAGAKAAALRKQLRQTQE